MPSGVSWYWQITGAVKPDRPETVYDISAFRAKPELIAQLKRAGKQVICYFSAGTHEPNRPDAAEFPAGALGKPMKGWETERWLDVRHPAVRELMVRRIEMARQKGCDGIEPDNTDGFRTDTGFPLTEADQIDYYRFLADAAHARGLLIALKNTIGLVAELIDFADFAIVESCYDDGDCGSYAGFARQGKAVLIAHYGPYNAALCREARASGFSLAFGTPILDGGSFEGCRD